jgi:GNAT superfamily N-acetyltransferase
MTQQTLPQPDQGGLAAFVSDLRCSYRRHGLRALLAKVYTRIRTAIFTREEFVVLAKDLSEVPETSFDGSLTIEELEPRHLPALYRFNSRRCDSKANARALGDVERGYRGYVAYADAELVGYYWWVDRRIEPQHRDIADYGLELELGERDVYGFDFFLLEEHRGGGNSVAFLNTVETLLRALGYRTLWGYVVAANKPARWLYSMRGYRPVTRIESRTVLARRMPVRSEGAAPGGSTGEAEPSVASH